LDVIYHLIEDPVFDEYMRRLFAASERFVILYSSDSDDNHGYEGTHVRQRKFTRWVAENEPGWKLVEHVPNRYPYQADTAWPNRRLDYVFVSWPRPKPLGNPLRAHLAGTDAIGELHPSDHAAVVVDLSA
jgi:hypothetical protein